MANLLPSVTDTTKIIDIPNISFKYVYSETEAVSDDLGQQINFNGTSTDFVTIGNNYRIPTTAFTIEFWYNSTTWVANSRALDYSASGPSGGVSFVQTGSVGELDVSVRNGASNFEIPIGTFADGTWHHVVATFDGTTLLSYADGVSVGTHIATMSDPVQTVFLGRRSAAVSNFFTGSIAAFRIYGRAITSAEVGQHYNGVFNNEASLQVWYKFSNGVAADYSGNSNTGTINGTTQQGFAANPYITIQQLSYITTQENTAVSETSIISAQVSEQVSDSTAISELITVEIIDQGIAVSDSSAVSEVLKIELVSYISNLDSVVVSEAIVFGGGGVQISETVVLSEATKFDIKVPLSLQEVTAIHESVSIRVGRMPNIKNNVVQLGWNSSGYAVRSGWSTAGYIVQVNRVQSGYTITFSP